MGNVVPFTLRNAPFRLLRSEDGGSRRYIVIDPASGVVPPAQYFLHELSRFGNKDAGTLKDVGYIIVSWLNYLRGSGKYWDEDSADDFIEWLDGSDVYKTRKGRRANVIWRWYRFLSSHHNYAAAAKPIFLELSQPTSRSEPTSPRYSVGRGPTSKVGKRKIPDTEDVQHVLQVILKHRNPFISEREWLIARLMSECGLRAAGISSLNTLMISAALAQHNVIPPGLEVMSIANDRHAKSEVRYKMELMARSGRSGIVITITEKFGKNRDVLLKFDLVNQLLDYLWGHSRMWLSVNRMARTGFPIFLSIKSKAALSPGAISDIMRASFKKAKVPGSGHSLRAYQITSRAVELIYQAKKHSNLLDIEGIALILAEESGHSHIKTITPYIDVVRVANALADEVDIYNQGDNIYTKVH